MKKQKWMMMMGATAVVCSALFVPGAFAKEKDDVYVAPVVFTKGAPLVQNVDQVKNTIPTSSTFIIPPAKEDVKVEKK
ncbi:MULTISPECIES: hypothetical protein [Brevibacillus]|jgi:hypothetical protein|uniref:hypothetical protein n=1 Tax=Brevibacillus TaxID=55080 RepID=UPI000ED5A03E|nr:MULTISPECIES: hypothetical protein [Brevibacillus]MBU8713018.1 hypothetical protein [Brevibacillus parabrevis]MDH6348537.1 hypothetical protein [Brevibacillus sp. 1238]MDR5002316.1 hypothetical protein [Brevibacillus parabrevis]MED2256373.1 hypothetical protein [Brevibacillus parabrevis]NRQ53046.1 hypothetical protein [Brevibacillus sp. HD1.4A]